MKGLKVMGEDCLKEDEEVKKQFGEIKRSIDSIEQKILRFK